MVGFCCGFRFWDSDDLPVLLSILICGLYNSSIQFVGYSSWVLYGHCNAYYPPADAFYLCRRLYTTTRLPPPFMPSRLPSLRLSQPFFPTIYLYLRAFYIRFFRLYLPPLYLPLLPTYRCLPAIHNARTTYASAPFPTLLPFTMHCNLCHA